jgi:hypothetical protein
LSTPPGSSERISKSHPPKRLREATTTRAGLRRTASRGGRRKKPEATLGGARRGRRPAAPSTICKAAASEPHMRKKSSFTLRYPQASRCITANV